MTLKFNNEKLKTYIFTCVMLSTCCFHSLPAIGQKQIESFYLRKVLLQNNLQLQFTVLDKDDRGVRNYDKNKFYFWFKGQKVMNTQGGASGDLLHGSFEAHYSNKQLESKGKFKKGLKSGEWISWYQDGRIKSTEKWKKGEQKGGQRYYHNSGELDYYRKVGSFKEVVRNGDSLFIDKGQYRTLKVYSNDSLQLIQHFKLDQLHGISKILKDGKVVSKQNYKNGQLIPARSSQKEEREEEKSESKLKEWFKKVNPFKHREPETKTDKTREKKTKSEERKKKSKKDKGEK